jgi:prepilin-type processing-associated H-X9-DG protein
LLGDGGTGGTISTKGFYYWKGCAADSCGTDPAGLATIPGGGATRHLDGTNVAFADGHVKWEKGVAGTGPSEDGKSASIYNGNYGADHGQPTFKPTAGGG